MSDLLNPIRKDALISDCGTYRYWLSRKWEPSVYSMPIVMLNPSTADAELDDPTIRRCMSFARREGYGGIFVVNLYAFRATDPKELTRVPFPHGGDNAYWLDIVLDQKHSPVLCAWGANADADTARNFVAAANGYGTRLVCLGKTKDGSPRHPLYVKSGQPFEAFP